jgi:acetyl-CoA carboxylase biotin carboxyl carrier protein
MSGGMSERQVLVSRVKALAEALEGSDVGELELTEGGTRIHIRRRLEAVVIQQPAERAPVTSHPRRRRAQSESTTVPSGAAPDPTIAIVAPLTGVFYASPSPSSPPFVEVGEPVQHGQIVCIVEAMKVFNEIKAEVSGMVTAVVAQSGQLVQKGDALIRVKPV